MKPVAIKATTVEELLASVRKKQEEYNAMSPEERAVQDAKTKEALKNFAKIGGPMAGLFMVRPKK